MSEALKTEINLYIDVLKSLVEYHDKRYDESVEGFNLGAGTAYRLVASHLQSMLDFEKG